MTRFFTSGIKSSAFFRGDKSTGDDLWVMTYAACQFIHADINDHDAAAGELTAFAHHVVIDVADGFAGDEDVIAGDAFTEHHLVADKLNDLSIFNNHGILLLNADLDRKFRMAHQLAKLAVNGHEVLGFHQIDQ